MSTQKTEGKYFPKEKKKTHERERERENMCYVSTEPPGRKVMIDASVFGRSSKSEATSAEPWRV